MELEQFEEGLRKDDFAVGDSFWLGDWEFEVVNRRRGGVPVDDEVVFRWELTRQEFVQVIADNHPEIEDPEGFFGRHEDDIIYRFRKGFDILMDECGCDCEIPMLGAIDEAVEQERAKGSASCHGATGRGIERAPTHRGRR